MTTPRKADAAAAADILRALLAKEDSGELAAASAGRPAAIRRRLEGAALGLEAASGRQR